MTQACAWSQCETERFAKLFAAASQSAYGASEAKIYFFKERSALLRRLTRTSPETAREAHELMQTSAQAGPNCGTLGEPARAKQARANGEPVQTWPWLANPAKPHKPGEAARARRTPSNPTNPTNPRNPGKPAQAWPTRASPVNSRKPGEPRKPSELHKLGGPAQTRRT